MPPQYTYTYKCTFNKRRQYSPGKIFIMLKTYFLTFPIHLLPFTTNKYVKVGKYEMETGYHLTNTIHSEQEGISSRGLSIVKYVLLTRLLL